MKPRLRLLLAVLMPFVACGVQWLLWDAWIKPYVWFLFFPAAFLSAWLGGQRGGVAGGVIGALLVWYVYMAPQFSLALKGAASGASIAMFMIMGVVFGWVFERLDQAQRRTAGALAATEAANARITELYEKTLELDELKSQFFANVSHELRTPLTLIMAPLERRLAVADFQGESRQEAEMMLRNVRLLYRHVSDLLDAAKLEAGGMKADYARVDLAELVRALASHFEPVAQERGIAFRVVAPPALAIEADGGKLQRILLNLLSNAFKFTPAGGTIELRLATEEDAAVLEVQDNGPGVPGDMREAVFERFRQVEGAANRSYGGTGLGLAIVREFAALHGGTAGVSEPPGGGALFAVRLPLRAPAGTGLHEATGMIDRAIERQAVEELTVGAAPAGDDVVAAGDARRAPLVLVVEDNADMNAFIADTLRPRYRVASAGDGRDGLEKALALVPDLILCDVMMPVMSGDAMVLELRLHPELAAVPIVMLTAKADDELRVRMLKAGVQDYLAKPFGVEELLARVDGLVAERRRGRVEVNRYEQIVATSGDALALIDHERRYQVVNPVYASMFGLTPAELRQRPVAEVVGAANYERIGFHLDRAFAGEVRRFVAEPGFPDGRRRVLDAEYRPLVQEGAITGVVASLRDITVIKQAEEDLHRRNDELERLDRAATGRELQMIELKRRINEMARELGRAPPYDLSFAETPREVER